MLSRRYLVLTALAANAAPIARAFAAESRTFDAGSFAAAQKAGKPILVAIHASWCPTCKAGGVVKLVGICRDAISGGVRLSDQAARSIG